MGAGRETGADLFMTPQTRTTLKALPVVLKAQPDELLSSWLARHARYYGVGPLRLLRHCGLSSPSLEALDQEISFGQKIMLAGFFHREPSEIAAMTNGAIRPEFRSLIRKSLPVQRCRYCVAERSEAGGAIRKSWMQGWRVTCRVCGNRLVDISSTLETEKQSRQFAQHWELACVGEAIFESCMSNPHQYGSSPMTVLRLLLMRRWPAPRELWSGYRPSRLLNVILPGFDDVVQNLELKPSQFHNFVRLVGLRIPLLAGVAIVMRDPVHVLSQLRDNSYVQDRKCFARIEIETARAPDEIYLGT